MKQVYNKLSSLIYDITTPPGHSIDGDIEFYKKYLIPLDGTILDPCVGNGRFIIPFLKYNVDIIGFDNSLEMLELCKNNLKLNNLKTNICLKDLRSFEDIEKYSAIVMPNASFNLIASYLNVEEILIKFYQALKPKGMLTFDLANISSDTKAEKFESIHEVGNEKYKVSTAIWFDKSVNILSSELKYFREIENEWVLEETQYMQLAKIDTIYLEKILQQIGFNSVEIFHNFSKKDSLRIKTITFICYK